MARKRFTPEQIIGKLREAEVLLAQGEKMGVVCKRIAVTEQSEDHQVFPPGFIPAQNINLTLTNAL